MKGNQKRRPLRDLDVKDIKQIIEDIQINKMTYKEVAQSNRVTPHLVG
jgi:hypothetical protein